MPRAMSMAAVLLLLSSCAPEGPPPGRNTTSVLLADTLNTTGDPAFDAAVKHALAFALAPSPSLAVVEGERVADSLRAMNRSADARVTADIAWEIAVEQEIDTLVLSLVTGSLDEHVITIDVIDPRDGHTLVREAVRARTPGEVIDGIGRAAGRVRRGLGEPEASVAASETPLSRLATSSFEALAHYARGREHADRGRHAMAVPFYCEALAFDPAFTQARAALAASTSRTTPGGAPDC